MPFYPIGCIFHKFYIFSKPSLDCELCLPKTEKYMIENGVTNYPRKGKKAAQRAETSLVYILKCKSSNKYCLAQRPDTGLLANLLEFPSVALPNWSEDSTMTITSVLKNLNEHYNLKATTKQVSNEPKARLYLARYI